MSVEVLYLAISADRKLVGEKKLATRTLRSRPPALKPPAAEEPTPCRRSSFLTLLTLGPAQSSVKATRTNFPVSEAPQVGAVPT
jgi:hypothetical protein